VNRSLGGDEGSVGSRHAENIGRAGPGGGCARYTGQFDKEHERKCSSHQLFQPLILLTESGLQLDGPSTLYLRSPQRLGVRGSRQASQR
jgi:hypothetical protein